MKYMIFKGNQPQGNKKFETYEKARQTARKWCRRSTSRVETESSNPSLKDHGYRIIAVNA